MDKIKKNAAEYKKNSFVIKSEPVEVAIEYDVSENVGVCGKNEFTATQAPHCETSNAAASECLVSAENGAELPEYSVDIDQMDIKQENASRPEIQYCAGGSGTADFNIKTRNPKEDVNKSTDYEISPNSQSPVQNQQKRSFKARVKSMNECSCETKCSSQCEKLKIKALSAKKRMRVSNKSKDVKNITPPVNSYLHTCQECGKYFRRLDSFLYHMRNHTGEKPHVCQHCGKSFIRPTYLLRHIRIHTGEKPHVCQDCGKSFSQVGTLYYHMKIHTGEKSHVCKECGKCFSRSQRLRQHLSTHTGERPHSCHDCGKGFSELGNLRKHMRIHSGEKPHICQECGKCFGELRNLREHVSTHTGEKLYSCQQCSKCFNHSSGLLRHMRTH